MQVPYGDRLQQYVSWPYIMERQRHLTTALKPVPMNVNFPDLRNMLAIAGGKLLVSVLRDIISDKVSWCVSSESHAGHWQLILDCPRTSNVGWRASICTHDFLGRCPRQFFHNVSRHYQQTTSSLFAPGIIFCQHANLSSSIHFFPPIETAFHPCSKLTVSSASWCDYNNGYVDQSSFSNGCSNTQQIDKLSYCQMRRRLCAERRPGKAGRKAFDACEGLVEWVAGRAGGRRFRRSQNYWLINKTKLDAFAD